MAETRDPTPRESRRLGRELSFTLLRAPFKSPDLALAPATADAGDWEGRKILPPFLGEMGFEIRYFLAAVEPWLRSGWRIPARRPEYYPPGTAFADPALFAELNERLDQARAKPIGCSLGLLDGAAGNFFVGARLDPDSGLLVQTTCPDMDETRRAVAVALLELDIRRIFARHHLRKSRPVTPWDIHLTAVFDGRADQLAGGATALRPSYRPAAFEQPTSRAYPHVGVQFRHIPHNPSRNSNVARVLAEATAAAEQLGLPLLVYGHPNGTIRPEGLTSTHELAGDGLLEFELGMLSQCRVMFAPESGWCDLMCWLQVPTILECLSRPHTFSCMTVFQPRVLLRDPGIPIAAQLDHLFSAQTLVPASPRDPAVFDDCDWDGDWIRSGLGEFLGT